jgi:hypothetical protein
MRARRYSRQTEQLYVDWVRRFILFHGKRHPRELGEEEIVEFLSDLAVKRKVSASAQNQAFCASSRSHRAVIRVYDEAGNVIEMREQRAIPKRGEAIGLKRPAAGDSSPETSEQRSPGWSAVSRLRQAMA